jgi:hypothetical protein
MKWMSKARPLLFLGLIVLMVAGISGTALADEPGIQETEAPVGEAVVDGDGVIARDDERPPAVEPTIEPGIEEPTVIAPGPEEPMIVNPDGTIGIEENLIAPAPGATADGGWSADDWAAWSGTAAASLLIGAGVAFLTTRRHYVRKGGDARQIPSDAAGVAAH